MRTSFLSRSVIAVASLAIGSVALAAVPATSATPAGITRELVLTAAQGFYANEGAQHSPPSEVIESYQRLVALTCDFDATMGENEIAMGPFEPFVNGTADGILITAELYEPASEDGTPWRYCTFAALATADASFSLAGNISVTLTGDDPAPRLSAASTQATAAALSGNVFVTEPISVDNYRQSRSASLTTSGSASRTVNVTSTEKVTTPKSKAAKKAAKKVYDKKVKAAKKSYAKALKKAKTKSKKKAAKKSYNKKKAAAKLAYNKAIVTVKTVQKTVPQTESRPFAVSVSAETRTSD